MLSLIHHFGYPIDLHLRLQGRLGCLRAHVSEGGQEVWCFEGSPGPSLSELGRMLREGRGWERSGMEGLGACFPPAG